jgi:hypothetical protein
LRALVSDEPSADSIDERLSAAFEAAAGDHEPDLIAWLYILAQLRETD